MKTFEEIVKQQSVYLHNWEHKIDVIGDFEGIHLSYEDFVAEEAPYPNVRYWLEEKRKMSEALEEYKNINILFASYGEDNYSGDAWVLFERNGKLYEVNGGHCSCYGLEDQWDEEEILLKELENRLINGNFGEDDWSGNEFKEELCEFLGIGVE